MAANLPDQYSQRVWFMLVIVGMILALVGWYEFLR